MSVTDKHDASGMQVKVVPFKATKEEWMLRSIFKAMAMLTKKTFAENLQMVEEVMLGYKLKNVGTKDQDLTAGEKNLYFKDSEAKAVILASLQTNLQRLESSIWNWYKRGFQYVGDTRETLLAEGNARVDIAQKPVECV